MELLTAARAYFDHGYTPIPLRLDPAGFPKIPISQGWSDLPHEWPVIEALPWAEAKGLGLPLGKQAGGVAAIDIDDNDMARATLALFDERGLRTRMVETARKRVHVYVREATTSTSTSLTVTWQGRQMKVELKATGTQVAAPPSPGYRILNNAEPMSVPTVSAAWLSLAHHLGITQDSQLAPSSNFPRPWRASVGKEERNKSAFIEACTLRDAGASLDTAMGLMQARFDRDYAPGDISWREIEKTVQSAFKKTSPKGQQEQKYRGLLL